MSSLIATIFLFGSLIGIGVMVFRKIPILLTLPEAALEKEGLISRLKKEILKLNPFKNFSLEIFLQKTLSKIRILTLKAENKTGSWLQKLREKAQKKKIQENDNYWQEIKKSTKE